MGSAVSSIRSSSLFPCAGRLARGSSTLYTHSPAAAEYNLGVTNVRVVVVVVVDCCFFFQFSS